MLKKRLVACCFIIIIAMLAASCSGINNNEITPENSASSPWEYSFYDSTGAKVTLYERPQKAALLFSSYADIWVIAGGVVDITVRESIERGFADESAILVDKGAGHTSIDLETLIESSPDIVIGTSDYQCQAEAVEICRAAGIPSAMFHVESFDDYLNVLEIFCNITGEKERYELYGLSVKEQIDKLFEALSAKADSLGNRKSILFVRAGSSQGSTKAKTADDNFVCVMLDELGTRNIASTENGLTGSLSLEAIMVENPDYLFITTMGNEQAAIDYMNSLLESDGWKELSCVKNGNYCYLPKELFHFKPNSRWAEAYEYLANILYPEAIK